MRQLFDFTGATFGVIPMTSIDLTMAPTWTGAHIFAAGVTTTTLAGSGAFGCNGQPPQASAAIGVGVVTTAATSTTPFGYVTQAQADDIVNRLNAIRAALIANGIMV
jgi:hypothetical protein